MFLAGAPAGIELLDMHYRPGRPVQHLGYQSFDGQNALKPWFDQGVVIITRSLPTSVSKVSASAGLAVTPEVVDDLVGFLGAVGDLVPVLAELLSIVGEAHILTVPGAALTAIGDVITPLVQPAVRLLQGVLRVGRSRPSRTLVHR